MHPAAATHLTPEQQLLLAGAAVTTAICVLARPGILSSIPLGWIRRRGPGISVGREWVSDSARLRHTHIVGATGTGKTVLIERLLFSDLARGYGAVIIDPKGERGFYESVRDHCKSIGRESDLFLLSATSRSESCTWNPCGLGNASELQTKFFNSAIYNEAHYAKACEYGLLCAFKSLTATRRSGFDVRDLIRELESIGEDDRNETLKGLFFDLNNLVLGEWEPILMGSGKKGQAMRPQISLLDIVTQNKILFVDLPTEGKKVQSSRIGRLLTQEIILISGMRKRHPELKGDRPFSVYIDEFDAFATESFSTFLNKGRSSEFMIHLAHQTLSDLNCIGPEFTGQILGNCNVRFIFRQDDPDDAERWARFIGTRKTSKHTYRTEGGQKTGDTSMREVQEFAVAPDQIKSLKIGRCVFSIKTESRTKLLTIPFESPAQTMRVGGAGPLQVEMRGTGHEPRVDLSPSDLAPALGTSATTLGNDKWRDLPVKPRKKEESK